MMNAFQRQRRRLCRLTVPVYLARWAEGVFARNAVTGGLVFPPGSDLYHCLWHVMQRRPALSEQADGASEAATSASAVLAVHLPYRRRQDGVEGKDPAFYNHLSRRGCRQVVQQLKALFDLDFHRWMEQRPAGVTVQQHVRDYARQHQLGIDAEDMLKKNWYRHRRRQRDIASGQAGA